MPAIIVFLGSLVTSIATYLAQRWGERMALFAAFAAVWLGLLTAFSIGINMLINGLMVSAPSGGLVQAGFSLLPGNAAACASAWVSANVLAWVYTTQYKFLVQRLRP